MTENIKFTGGNNLKGIKRKIHEVMMKTERKDGYGAYELSFAGTANSGLSFGGNQIDLSSNGYLKYRDYLKKILKDAVDENHNSILTDNELAQIKDSHLMTKGKKPEKIFEATLLSKINKALSSEHGINKINEMYPDQLAIKVNHVRKAISLLDNKETQKLLLTDEWMMRLVDYHNKFNMETHKINKKFPEYSILRFLNGDETTLNNYEYNAEENRKIDPYGQFIKKGDPHQIKLKGKMPTAEDYEKYIRCTDEYNKSESSKKGVDNRIKKLNHEIEKHKIIEVEVLKQCGEPKMIEKPVIDYSAAFDVSSQVDSTMQIIKDCKNDPKNNDPNKLVPYGNADARLYEHGANPNIGVYDHNTHKHTPPVQMAFDGKKYKLLKMLLEHNADLRELDNKEFYYESLEKADTKKNFDEESFIYFQQKIEYFQKPYDEKYAKCKEKVTNDMYSTQSSWYNEDLIAANGHKEL